MKSSKRDTQIYNLKESAFTMRKQTKLVAVLSAAALLAIGASMTSMAAQGWQQEGEDWYYYDNNGDYVTNDWRKSGNNWYYLGDDGYMMKNYLLEDGDNIYYLDGNGVMVTNAWVAYTPEDDYEDDAPDHYWYYFQSNGRAVVQTGDTVKKKTINGKTYGFDEDGRMLYGFVTDDGEKITDENPFIDATYYFGDSDDGAMHTSWLQYMDGSDSEDWYEDLTEMWFYFNPSNGKMVKDNSNKSIDGNKYAFDENGVMVSGWDDVTTTSTPNKYFNGDTEGWLARKGWIWAVPAEDINKTDYDDETNRWFYAASSGKVYTDDIKTIGGRKYIFDHNGIMRSGLVLVDTDDTIMALADEEATEGAEIMGGDFMSTSTYGAAHTVDINSGSLYYFSADEETDGSMKTGKNIVITLEDDDYTFGFEKSGKAYHGEKDNKIYLHGVLVEASSDYRYQAVTNVFADDSEGTPDAITDINASVMGYDNSNLDYDNYVVGTSGTIVKPGKYVKDTDDGYYAVSDATANKGEVAYFEDSEFAREKAKDWADNGAVGEVADFDNDGYDEYKSSDEE